MRCASQRFRPSVAPTLQGCRAPQATEGIIDLLQASRIFRFAVGHEGDAHARGGGKLALGVGAGTNSDRFAGAATAREIRQGSERRTGAAEMIDESPERARSDVVAADQAQAIKSLLIADVIVGSPAHAHVSDYWWVVGPSVAEALVPPILPSRPLTSRAMLPRCMIQSSTDKTRKSLALWKSC